MPPESRKSLPRSVKSMLAASRVRPTQSDEDALRPPPVVVIREDGTTVRVDAPVGT